MEFFHNILLLIWVERCCTSTVINRGSINAGDMLSNCDVKEEITKKVYLGWPHKISCQLLERIVEYAFIYSGGYDYEYKSYDYVVDQGTTEHLNNITCSILDLDNNMILYNKTAEILDKLKNFVYNISDLNQQHSLNYIIGAIWNTGEKVECQAVRLHLKVEEFKNLTCEQSYNISQILPLRRQELNENIFFSCDAPHDTPSLHHDLLTNHSLKWYKDCEELQNTSVLTVKNHKNALHIPSLTFEHPGVFTCAVTYKGMTRFVLHHPICVSPIHADAKRSIRCTKKIYYTTIGETIVIECMDSIGNRQGADASYQVTWEKRNATGQINFKCQNGFPNKLVNATNLRSTCSFHSDKICFRKIPSQEDRRKPRAVFIMKLTIKNINTEDFGTYVVSVHRNILLANTTIILAHNIKPSLTRKTTIGGICGVILLSIILVLLLLLWKRDYVLLYYKRKFGTFVLDDKRYGAFLCYHFSSNMDKFAKQKTRDAVSFVREELLNLGYTIFDETKDICGAGSRANGAMTYMKQSHRVVIILTAELLKDQWKVFTLQKGFEEMITAGSRMIFIVLPGVREYVKQHSLNDDTFRLVRRAVKNNRAIEWSDNKKFDSRYFSILLELSMPKLISQTMLSRQTSTLSSITSYSALYKHGFRRTISNETRTTELESRASVGDQSDEFTVQSETAA